MEDVSGQVVVSLHLRAREVLERVYCHLLKSVQMVQEAASFSGVGEAYSRLRSPWRFIGQESVSETPSTPSHYSDVGDMPPRVSTPACDG